MGKVKVSNGKETLEIDGSDLGAAVKDGYKPTERIIVANSQTKESYEIDPNDVQGALEDGFSFQDIVKKKQSGGPSPLESKSSLPAEPTTEPLKDLLTLAKERKAIKQKMAERENLKTDRRMGAFYKSDEQDADSKALRALDDQVIAQGTDPEFTDDIADLPGGEGFSFAKSIPSLIKLKKENEFLYKRTLAAMKSKGELHNAIAAATDTENAKFLVQQLQSTERKDYREGTRDAINLANQFAGTDEERNKIKAAIAQDKYFDYGLRGMDDQDERFQGLNPYQTTYLHFLEDTNPGQFKALSGMLQTNPDDIWMGSNEEAIRKGYEQKAREAELGGMAMMQKAYEEQLAKYKAKSEAGQLTEQEHADAQKIAQDYQTLLQDKQNQGQRYPLAALTDANRVIQDVYGSEYNQGAAFLQGVTSNFIDKPIDFIESIVGGGQDKTIDDLEKLGDQDYTDMVQWLTPEGESEKRQYITTVSPQLKEKLDKIWADDKLSESDRREKMRLLVAENQDHVGYEKNPEAGEINLTGKSILNRINTTASQILPQLALAYMTGGTANASQAQQLASLFGSTLAMSTHDYYVEALRNNIANPGEYAFTHAVIEAASELPFNNFKQLKEIFGTGKVGKILGEISEDEFNAITKASKGRFAKVADAFLNTVKASNKAAIEEGAEEFMGQVAHNVANKEMFDQQGDSIMDGSLKSFVNTYIGMLPLGILGGFSQHKNSTIQQKHALFEAVSDPNTYLDQLNKQVASGQIDQKQAEKIKATIQKGQQIMATIPSENLNGQKFTDNQRAEYLYNQIAKADIKEQMKDVPESIKEQMKEQAEKLDEENADILKEKQKAKPRVRVPVGKPVEPELTEDVKPGAKPIEKVEDFESELSGLLNTKEQAASTEAPLPKLGESEKQSNLRPKDEDVTVYKDPKTVVQKAREFFADDPLINRVADFLEPILEANPNIRIDTDAKVQEGVLGYSYGDGKVELNFDEIKDYETLYRTALHEMVHAATRSEIKNNTAFQEDLQAVLDDVREAMGVPKDSSIISAFVARGIIDENKYGAANEYEMLAEVFSNQNFHDALKNMEYKGDNILRKLFIAIAKYFSQHYKQLAGAKAGISADNIADYLMQLSESIVGGKQTESVGDTLPSLKGDEKMKAVRDLIERSKNIPAEQLKEALGRAGFTPEEIAQLLKPRVRVKVGEPAPERKFTKQELANEDILPEAKEGIRKNLNYVRQRNVISALEAKQVLDALTPEEALDTVMHDDELKPAVRVVLAQALILKFNELAANATDDRSREYYIDKTIEVANYVAEELGTKPGQMIQALSLFSRLTPEAQIRAANKQLKKASKKAKSRQRKSVDKLAQKLQQANEEAAEEITQDPEVKKTTSKAVQKAKEKAKKARDKRKDILDKFKRGDGGITLTSGGLTKEGIEFIGNLAKTYIDEGLAKVEEIAAKIFEDIKGMSQSLTDDHKKQVLSIIDDEVNRADLRFIGKALKDEDIDISRIIKEHYTKSDKAKENLSKKLVDEFGLSGEDAKELERQIKEAFDRIATKKKLKILNDEKKRLENIAKGLKGAKAPSINKLADDIIKYSNLGAFDTDDFLNMLADKLGTGNLTPEQAKELKRLADRVQSAPEGSPKVKATEELLTYRAKLEGLKWGEVTQAVWYANVLSGYATHIKNIVSTFFNGTFFAAAEVIKNPLSIPAIFVGGLRGLKRGFGEAWHTVKSGETPIHISKIETPPTLERVKFLGGWFNPVSYLKFVGRLMAAEDVLQFQALKELRATQMAYREAAKRGGKNPFSKEIWKQVNEQLFNTKERYEEAKKQAEDEGFKGLEKGRRIRELMEMSRDVQMTEDAYGFAAKGTFNHEVEGTLGALSLAVSSILDVKFGSVQPIRFLIPFTRIITNVANTALDFSPIGFVRAIRGVRGLESFEHGRTKGAYRELTQEEKRQYIARASLGIALTGALYAMTQIKGDDDEPLIDITGGGTGDLKKDMQLRQSGWQPYSIKIGNKYYSYFLTPLVVNLSWIGNRNDRDKYDDGYDEDSFFKKLQMSVYGEAQLLGDMTWIGGTADILRGLSTGDVEQAGKEIRRTLENSAKSFVLPNVYSQLAQKYEQIYNIPQKDVQGFWQGLIQDIPIARNSLNDRINALGDPIIRDRDIIISEETADPVMKFLLDKKAWVSTVNKNSVIIFDEQQQLERLATPDEYYEFAKKRGQLIKEELRKIMQNGGMFIEEDDGTKKMTTDEEEAVGVIDAKELTSAQLQSLIRSISTKASKQAKEELFNMYQDE